MCRRLAAIQRSVDECRVWGDAEFCDGEIGGLETVDEEPAFQHVLVFVDHDFDQRLLDVPRVVVANDAPAVLRRPQERKGDRLGRGGYGGEGPATLNPTPRMRDHNLRLPFC